MSTVYVTCEDCEEEIGSGLGPSANFAELISEHEDVCSANEDSEDEDEDE